MITFKTDWQFFSDSRYNNIRDENFTIIYSNEGDFHTAKIVHRSRELHEALTKAVTLIKAGENLEGFLGVAENLLKEIDKKCK